jgi:hypothetical protein
MFFAGDAITDRANTDLALAFDECSDTSEFVMTLEKPCILPPLSVERCGTPRPRMETCHLFHCCHRRESPSPHREWR